MKRRLAAGGFALKGFKVRKVILTENDLILKLRHKVRGRAEIILHGIIGMTDYGIHGKALGPFRIEDKGSYKSLGAIGRKGEDLLACDFMEADLHI